jgi:lysophospholipase L1-like esterase
MTVKEIVIWIFSLSLFCSTAMAAENDSLKYFDASRFQLMGKGFADTENLYERLPASLKGVTREAVWNLSKNSSGLAVRFRTNSRTIAVKWEVTNNNVMNHFAPTGIKGLDLYALEKDKWQYVNTARPSGKFSTATIISHMTNAEREFILYLPLYDGLSQLEIGIEPGAFIGDPLIDSPQRNKPVVFYGTSITQGGCASRPGMAYPNILSRILNRQIINLGFSGNGKLDPEIAAAMAEIDASCFVIDCLPNCSPELIREKYIPFVKIIREKKPAIPILLVENVHNAYMPFDQRKDSLIHEKNKLLQTIRTQLIQGGDRNLSYLKADHLTGDDSEGTVDGVHLTDLGFLRMSRKMFPVIRKLIR